MQKGGGARTRGDNGSRARRAWQRLRPQPRRKMGKTRRWLKRTVRKGCSRTASAAWAAASGGDSPPSRAPSGPAGSGPPPSGTRQAATGASQNTPGFLQQNAVGLDEEDVRRRGKRDSHPCPAAMGPADGLRSCQDHIPSQSPLKRARCPGSGADGTCRGKGIPTCAILQRQREDLHRALVCAENKVG